MAPAVGQTESVTLRRNDDQRNTTLSTKRCPVAIPQHICYCGPRPPSQKAGEAKPAAAPASRVCRVRIVVIARVLAKALVEAAHVRPWMAAATHVHAHAEPHALHAHTLVHALGAHLLPTARRSNVRKAAEVALLAAVGGVEEGARTRAATAEAL